MLKFPLLVSAAEGTTTPAMRTLADVLAAPVTVHGYVPSFAVPADMTVGKVEPPSVDRSIRTLPVRLVEVHRMVCDEPIVQISPPLGESMVIVGCTMVKFALLTSRTDGAVTLEIRIRADVVPGPVTVHGSVPSLAVLAAMTVGKVEPPSVDRSILTLPVKFDDVQRIVCDEPRAQDSPPFGDVTVRLG